ncbi:sigma-70 family RNA polymerase sigma factor [Blautia coccoides]|uniref:RNA polymerase sigma factor n=1 Tax=Blautia producta TaxID=33035 RepID=UPI0028A4CCE4|nr:sigma-70 family RNA polymerase sigma factor [Blautia coccoides]MDT4376403.1 sigma-70 family RNA polymerase sigma factor [Blautia coccoides]
MMLSTEYRESIERRFHAFCKAVLHNEACNYYRERKRKAKHEISFEYLQENTSFALHSTDEYFILQDKPTAFAVNGQTVIVYSEKLAKALLCLSKRWREIILMRYYLQLNDKQIAALLGKPRTTVNYQKTAALKQLRAEMEKMKDEE